MFCDCLEILFSMIAVGTVVTWKRRWLVLASSMHAFRHVWGTMVDRPNASPNIWLHVTGPVSAVVSMLSAWCRPGADQGFEFVAEFLNCGAPKGVVVRCGHVGCNPEANGRVQRIKH